MKHLLTILSFLVFSTVCLNASRTEGLDSLFNRLSRHANATVTPVDYTGSWPQHQKINMGFVMQRRNGSGMTIGERIAIPSANADLADSLFEAIEYEGAWGSDENLKTIFDEATKTVYSVYYDEGADTLYFLRAIAEDEPCVPYDWCVRSHYDSSETDIEPLKLQYPGPEINWTEAVVRLYDEVKYNYVFYDKIKGKWDRIYRRTLRQMASATDDYERGRILQRMIAACGDGHTYVMLPREIETASSPFTTVMLADGLFIKTVESPELIDSGMQRGQKIIAVNGDSPEAWAQRELLPYVSSSTPQWTIHMMYDGYNFSQARNGTPMNLTLQNSDGSIIEIAHSVNGTKRDQSLVQAPIHNFKLLNGNIGLLTIADFQTNEVCEFFDSILPKIKSTDALIIDLRGNGGGNSGFGRYIISHLIDNPIASAPWTSRQYIPAFASWGMKEQTYHAAIDTISPAEDDIYVKPIAILTDRSTFSAAEDFCSILRGADRVKIVGTPTGGSTGNGVRPRLTSTIMANICSKHDIGVDGTEWVGRGIIPDIVVEESSSSYFNPASDAIVIEAMKALRQ